MCDNSNSIEEWYKKGIFAMMFIFIILTFAYIPKRSSFKDLEPSINYEKFVQAKKENSGILAMTIIFFLFIIFSILAIYSDCIWISSNDKELFYKGSKIINIVFIFICWILSISVLSKINKTPETYSSELLDKLKGKSTKIVIIETFSLVFYILDIIIYFRLILNYNCNSNSEPIKSSSPRISTSYTPTSYLYTSTSTNNQKQETSSQSVRRDIIEAYLTIQIYNALIEGIYEERGKIHYRKIVDFFKSQQYDGLMEENEIEREIFNIICFLSIKLSTRDKIVKSYSNNLTKNKFILCEYLLELILALIKLNIQKGIYKRTYYIIHKTTVENRFFVEMNMEIQRDNNQDRVKYHGVFRCRNNINETIQIIRKRV